MRMKTYSIDNNNACVPFWRRVQCAFYTNASVQHKRNRQKSNRNQKRETKSFKCNCMHMADGELRCHLPWQNAYIRINFWKIFYQFFPHFMLEKGKYKMNSRICDSIDSARAATAVVKVYDFDECASGNVLFCSRYLLCF